MSVSKSLAAGCDFRFDDATRLCELQYLFTLQLRYRKHFILPPWHTFNFTQSLFSHFNIMREERKYKSENMAQQTI